MDEDGDVAACAGGIGTGALARWSDVTGYPFRPYVVGMATIASRLARTVCLALVAGFLAACESLIVPSNATSTTTTTVPADPVVPDPVQFGACNDQSGSVPMVDRLVGLEAIATALDKWASAAADVRPALDFWARRITDRSLWTEGAIASGHVPAVVRFTETKPEPGKDPLDYDVRLAAFRQRENAGKQREAEQVDASAGAAADLADQIRSYHPETAPATDIAGCVSAVGELFASRAASSRSLVIFSDLDEYGPQEWKGHLSGVRVLVVHLCWVAASCQEQQDRWGSFLHDMGAESVRFVRPELAIDATSSFLLEVVS